MDLELVSTKALVDELFRRHDYGVVCVGRLTKEGDKTGWLLRWSGPVHACIGAALHMTVSLTKMMVDAGKNVAEGETQTPR